MAWGYWSATTVDRGRSPRRQTACTLPPVNAVPQAEPPLPAASASANTCCSPTCRSRCSSPCHGPCPDSPCQSITPPPPPLTPGGNGGGGGGGGIGNNGTGMSERNGNTGNNNSGIGGNGINISGIGGGGSVIGLGGICTSQQCQQQQQQQQQHQQILPPDEYSSRRQSLDRLDSPQANQLSDILCRGAVVSSIQSANNTLTRGASLRSGGGSSGGGGSGGSIGSSLPPPPLPLGMQTGSGSQGILASSLDTGDYDVPHPHPYTHHYMQTTSVTPPHSAMSLVSSRPGSAGGSGHGSASGSGSSPGCSVIASNAMIGQMSAGSVGSIGRCASRCTNNDDGGGGGGGSVGGGGGSSGSHHSHSGRNSVMARSECSDMHDDGLSGMGIGGSGSGGGGGSTSTIGGIGHSHGRVGGIRHYHHECIHYERLPIPVPIPTVPPPPPPHQLQSEEEIEPAYATVFPNVPSAPGMSCVGEDRSIYRRGARRWRKLYRINGHIFQAKRFNRRAFCAYCQDRIWGLGRQGFKCIQCKLLVHKKCHKLVQKHCTNEHVPPIDKNGSEELTEIHQITSEISSNQQQSQHDLVICQSDEQTIVEGEGESNIVNQSSGVGSGSGQLEPGTQRQYSIEDFELIRVIGRGSYAKVLMVELKKTRRIYAMKVIKKALVTDDEDIDWVQTEKHVFETASNHPFLVGLHSCFQTPSRLFFVIEFVRGGDLMFHMQRQRRLPEEHARFYAAEISLALNFLHEKGIIYRDLKLDNVLLDHEGHIKLTDYGMCKEGIRPGDTTSTFCGTPNYIAPEILRGEDYGFSVDWWALGVLLYEMLAGRSPFDIAGASENPDQWKYLYQLSENTEDYLFQVILEKTIRIPRSLSVKAASVLKGFLNKNPADRLGCHRESAFMDIVNHPFFKSIDWEMLAQKEVQPPFIPTFDPGDPDFTTNFDPQFTREPAELTPDDPRVIDKIDQSEFEGFEYVNPLLMSLEDCV